MDTTSCAQQATKPTSEAYEDALDSIRLYAASHPEWRRILAAIEGYVEALEETAGRHEPGL